MVNIQRLGDMEDPELTDFWQLLSYRDAITPEIQRAAFTAGVFFPCELYYRAPADLRDGLIAALLKTENAHEAANLMCCLAFQGDDKAMETLLELERNPRPWRKSLYVDPVSYTHLDVYKRQAHNGAEARKTAHQHADNKGDEVHSPVCDLDVYKRQQFHQMHGEGQRRNHD